jgi:hypothetical protein
MVNNKCDLDYANAPQYEESIREKFGLKGILIRIKYLFFNNENKEIIEKKAHEIIRHTKISELERKSLHNRVKYALFESLLHKKIHKIAANQLPVLDTLILERGYESYLSKNVKEVIDFWDKPINEGINKIQLKDSSYFKNTLEIYKHLIEKDESLKDEKQFYHNEDFKNLALNYSKTFEQISTPKEVVNFYVQIIEDISEFLKNERSNYDISEFLGKEKLNSDKLLPALTAFIVLMNNSKFEEATIEIQEFVNHLVEAQKDFEWENNKSINYGQISYTTVLFESVITSIKKQNQPIEDFNLPGLGIIQQEFQGKFCEKSKIAEEYKKIHLNNQRIISNKVNLISKNLNKVFSPDDLKKIKSQMGYAIFEVLEEDTFKKLLPNPLTDDSKEVKSKLEEILKSSRFGFAFEKSFKNTIITIEQCNKLEAGDYEIHLTYSAEFEESNQSFHKFLKEEKDPDFTVLRDLYNKQDADFKNKVTECSKALDDCRTPQQILKWLETVYRIIDKAVVENTTKNLGGDDLPFAVFTFISLMNNSKVEAAERVLENYFKHADKRRFFTEEGTLQEIMATNLKAAIEYIKDSSKWSHLPNKNKYYSN